jgi:hypothetical protein
MGLLVCLNVFFHNLEFIMLKNDKLLSYGLFASCDEGALFNNGYDDILAIAKNIT